MPRVRRLVGAFVHLLMLHLLVVGSGDACVLPAVAGAARTASAPADAGGMAGMAMPSQPAPDGERNCDVAGTAPAGHEQRQQAPACQSMAPCAPAALATASATVERPAAPVETGPLGIVVLAPASRTSAPEPPPPRA